MRQGNEAIKIQIETEEDILEYKNPVERSIPSELLVFYVRNCSYIPFFYLALLILTSHIFGETFSFILSVILSVITVLIHYKYRSLTDLTRRLIGVS